MDTGATDSVQCFSFLTENIPTWLTRVSDLAAHASAKHEEFKTDYLKFSNGEPSKPRKRKNSSLHTHRPDDEEAPDTHDHSPVSTHPTDPTTSPTSVSKPPDNTNNRKRKTEEKRDDTNHELEEVDRIIRPRTQVLIHYDSHTQTLLEKLVRDIGGARNHIRKGRMSYMMKSGYGRKTFSSSPDAAVPFYRSTRQIKAGPKGASNNTPFDIADQHLEVAQNLCETAAHQFLRRGDCLAELEKTKGKLSSALDMAKDEVKRLAEEAKHEEALEKISQEKEKEVERKKVEAEVTLNPAEKGDASPKGGIEVDDASDTSSISIDMTAFRATRLRR